MVTDQPNYFWDDLDSFWPTGHALMGAAVQAALPLAAYVPVAGGGTIAPANGTRGLYFAEPTSHVGPGDGRPDASIMWFDLSQSPTSPYYLATYFDNVGGFLTGAYILASPKKANAGGAFQGVSGKADGSEPYMVGFSPDVNGPTLGLEAHGSRGVGYQNQAVLAAYDLDDISGGATGWSPGYGKKKWAVSARGDIYWGADLGTNMSWEASLSRTGTKSLGLVGTLSITPAGDVGTPPLVLQANYSQVTFADGTMAAGSAVLQSATVGFSAADATNQEWVTVPGAGTNGGTLYAQVVGYTDATHVTLSSAAGTAVTNVSCQIYRSGQVSNLLEGHAADGSVRMSLGSLGHITTKGAGFIAQDSGGGAGVSLDYANGLSYSAAGLTQTTVGAAGAASALPGAPKKYMKMIDTDGSVVVFPVWPHA